MTEQEKNERTAEENAQGADPERDAGSKMSETENSGAEETAIEMTIERSTETVEQEKPAEKKESDSGEDVQDTRDRMFTLRFKIPLEDYLTFYRYMTAQDEQKNKKKMTIIGAFEMGIGIIYLLMALMGKTQSSVFTYVVCLMLLAMGAYGMTYYKYFYQGSLTRSVTKQYDKTAYFHSTMVIDFYPNRSIEHIGDEIVENLWSKIDSIRVSETAYMIMVDPKRCMLIPKGQIPGQLEQMESLVKLICENYEKPRYDV